MSNTATTTAGNKKTKKEPNYLVVDFLDLEPENFTFLPAKPNSHGGKTIGVRYCGKYLYVKYDTRVCPFGISSNTQDMSKKEPGKYKDDKKVTGYGVSLSLQKDYENDPYYQKACELDQFFIDQCIDNGFVWGLGGTKTKPPSREVIEGYDDKGMEGKWKRIVKYAYKKDKQTNERIYQDYPPRFEFGVITTSSEDVEDDKGMIVNEATFKPSFFDADGEKVENVNTENCTEVLPNWARIGIVAQWSNMTQGTYGMSLKPKVHQFRIFPSEGLDNDECLLGGEEEDAPEDVPDSLATFTQPKVKRVNKAIVEEEEVVEDEEEVVEGKEEDGEEVVEGEEEDGEEVIEGEEDDEEAVEIVQEEEPVVKKPLVKRATRRVMAVKKNDP